jgi:hypothetical protein
MAEMVFASLEARLAQLRLATLILTAVLANSVLLTHAVGAAEVFAWARSIRARIRLRQRCYLGGSQLPGKRLWDKWKRYSTCYLA